MNKFTTNISTFDHKFIGVVALCERYEIKMEITKVIDYRDGVIQVEFTGMGEDIELLVSEEELTEA